MEVQIPLIAGTLAAILHVISGPDHLAAVTPLVIESEKNNWKIGFSWGLGHLIGMLAIGFLFFLFRDAIPVEEISSYSEQLVGLILVLVGVWAFFKLFNQPKESQPAQINENRKTPMLRHALAHFINSDHQHVEVAKNSRTGNLSSLGIGFIHGLAGVAHFILLLPVLGFTSDFDSFQYIAGFAFGTVFAMTAYSFILGVISDLPNIKNRESFSTGIRFTGGLFAVSVGTYWLYLSL